jgi:hypothetical protein
MQEKAALSGAYVPLGMGREGEVMLRAIFGAVLGLLVVHTAASLNLAAADKAPQESSAEEQARQDVLAALKAEAAGDNERRRELLEGAARLAPDVAEYN